MIFPKSKNSFLSNTLFWCLAYLFLCEIDSTVANQTTIEMRTTKTILAKSNDVYHSANSFIPDGEYCSRQIYYWVRAGNTNNDGNKVNDFTREIKFHKTLIVKRGETQNEEDVVSTKGRDSQTNGINSDTTHASETNKDNEPTQTSATVSTKMINQIGISSTPVSIIASKPTPENIEETTARQTEITHIQSTTSFATATTTATTSTQSDPERTTSKDLVTFDSISASPYHKSTSTQRTTVTSTNTEYTLTVQEKTNTQSQTTTPTETVYESKTITTDSSEVTPTMTSTTLPTSNTDYDKSTNTNYTPSKTTEYITSLATTEPSALSPSGESPSTEYYTSTITSFEITSSTTQDSITRTKASTEILSTASAITTAEQQTESSSSVEIYNTFTSFSSKTQAESNIVPQPTASNSLSPMDNAETISAFEMSQTSKMISTVSTPTLAIITNESPTIFSNANSMFLGSETRFNDFPTSTRSFSVTSSTATPLLVLGSKECTGDVQAVNGKCPKEYFCNAAKKTCVLLLADGEQCFEDFQCESTYCITGRCGGKEKETSNVGGKIAGAVVGSVAGASLIMFALIRWRRRSRIIGRRMNQFQDTQRFYDATTTIVPEARLSKYNFLQQMLEPPQQGRPAFFNQIPAAASKRVHNRPPIENNYVAWGKEDEETLHRKTYQYF